MLKGDATVLIADSLDIVRTGLAAGVRGIGPEYKVIVADSGVQVLEEFNGASIDIVILDLSLKSPSGIGVLRTIKRMLPTCKVLVQYAPENTADAIQALSLGADGAVPRSSSMQAIMTAFLSVIAGYAVMKYDLVSDLIGLKPRKAKEGSVYGLTRREVEVMLATLRHGSARLVGEVLRISPRTVEAHRCSIYRKTACRTIYELQEIAHLVQGVAPVTSRRQETTSKGGSFGGVEKERSGSNVLSGYRGVSHAPV